MGNVAQGVWFLGSWLVFPTLTILQTSLEDRKRLRQLDTPLVIGSPLMPPKVSRALGPSHVRIQDPSQRAWAGRDPPTFSTSSLTMLRLLLWDHTWSSKAL